MEDYPDFDTVQAAGLDATLRNSPGGQPYTWEDVRAAQQAQQECPHETVQRDPADWSVGIMSDAVWCEDCGLDLSNDPLYDRNNWED